MPACSGRRGSKVRIGGLFRTRLWVLKSDVQDFQLESEQINERYRSMEANAKTERLYKEELRLLLMNRFHGACATPLQGHRHRENQARRGGRFVSPTRVLASGGLGALSVALSSPASATASVPCQLAAATSVPACSGLTASELDSRLQTAFRPVGMVEMHSSTNVPAAEYVKVADATSAYTRPAKEVRFAADIHWLPQEAADWLYQATHYALPLLQTLLETKKAFNATGHDLDSHGEGTEIGCRRDRALIPYDNDVDFEASVTPCCDFANIWQLAASFLEEYDLSCRVTIPGKYYRISPRKPLTLDTWRELCHEIRRPGLGRADVISAASDRKRAGDSPAQPIGPHWIGIGVKVATPGSPVVMAAGGAIAGGAVTAQTADPFPIVEGFCLTPPSPTASDISCPRRHVRHRVAHRIRHSVLHGEVQSRPA